MASDATYPLLDSADAERMLAYARAQAPGLSLPTDESAHIDEQINRVLADDRFLGSVEDALPAAQYLEARETLRVAAGTIENIDDSLTIASLGALTGQPALVATGYTRVARAWLDNNNTEEAEKFAAKAAAAGDDTALNEISAARTAASQKDFSESAPASAEVSSGSASNTSLAELQERLESAKSGDAKTHAAEFVAINDAVTGGDFDGAGATMGDILRTILESAVGALWASNSAADCERVATQSFTILSNARADEEYQQLPAVMLARFYSDAAQHSSSDLEQRVACFAAAAREFQRCGDLDGELHALLKTVALDIRHSDPEEAYDILASRYVDSLKLESLPVSAKWTVLYSESLRVQAQDMFKSTQVLLDFLDRHPVSEATTPSEHNAMAEVAELLGDRYSSADAADRARKMYHIAFNLFAAANNVRALEELRKKA
ncbi:MULTISPECIES: hypothetical protein [unclassified Corynebacterium]|uniref:hypothetical protein n=1 Tax=unclassified Corynebacterium TaxID=2624378 RepID=UPI0008A27764|nr:MULTISPECIES: hypothetical protein [unclassified Corynebacterium]OFN76783.1 hypothetical protein HMPREF2537_02305 [Corynebacterium sp. HMSC074E01]OHO63172.1 hypothetical protein HMPREF2743_01325 [Corynebacterium sp. HMSC036D02]